MEVYLVPMGEIGQITREVTEIFQLTECISFQLTPWIWLTGNQTINNNTTNSTNKLKQGYIGLQSKYPPFVWRTYVQPSADLPSIV